ncbi:MAG TPA: hypothetical protein PLQ01_10255 [Methanothrix sp.]|nr:hypothetical protein [Methanothrix sp.]HPC89577.1 hypothetical protein [Methanothrix sp.]HQI69076.1 hypothetical protein [Methanothrix sp.]HRS85238.1 hypothetical protein [Methanothrix sp.]HRT17141.1 hypothetical protein [Methanothrix sp.]
MHWPNTESARVLVGLGSASDTQVDLENKVAALENRLRQFENTCSDLSAQIANLQENLCETNRIIRDLESRNSRIKPAVVVLSILLVSSLIVCFPHQSSDLLASIYAVSKNGLNALMANPLLHRL